MPNFSRRQLLIAGSSLGFGTFVFKQGLRYPRMGFEPENPAAKVVSTLVQIDLKDAVYTGQDEPIAIRAIAPEPQISINFKRGGTTHIMLSNVASNAELQIDGLGINSVEEKKEGISRELLIKAATTKQVDLRWRLPNRDAFKFAVIGDTGGGSELDWCLQRAHELEAQFLLHVGDFNYTNQDASPENRSDEYELSIQKFRRSPLPVYISIGNHDFNQSGLVYQRFLNELGPMNHAFELGGTRFINMDTAADFFPAGSGNRGKLASQLISSQEVYDDQLIFTHKPMQDPREGEDHGIGSASEINWLREQMSELNCNTLLNGHVHHSDERDLDGIHQWTIGEGLGHEDLVHKRQVSKLVVGQVERGNKINYAWHALGMPWELHQSHTHETKLLKHQRLEQLEWYKTMINRQSIAT